VTVIGETLRTSPWVLIAKAGSPIKTMADLKGKRVGITGFGALSESEMKYQLGRVGLSTKDVELVALGNAPSQLAALQRGNADAVLSGSPYITHLLTNKEVQVVLDFSDTYWANNVITARTKALKANPDVYARFIKAYREALHRLVTDHDYATKIATELWGSSISAEDIQIELKDYTDRYWQPDATFTRDQYDLALQILLQSPSISKDGLPSFDDLTRYAPK
jgi:ABC-type nitrate/sulfonate/bicarbonate transport system substrate-binding protein